MVIFIGLQMNCSGGRADYSEYILVFTSSHGAVCEARQHSLKHQKRADKRHKGGRNLIIT